MLTGPPTLALSLALASAPPWPPSAGSTPGPIAAEHRDPRPLHYDPIAGLYRLPDGTYQQIDPPEGDYDPPPGLYRLEPADAPANAVPPPWLGPLPVLIDPVDYWRAKRRRLRISLGISGGVLAAGALGVALSLAFPNDCGATGDEPLTYNCEAYPIGLMVWAFAVVPASLVATIVYGVRLGRHNNRRPAQLRRVQLTPGGLRF